MLPKVLVFCVVFSIAFVNVEPKKSRPSGGGSTSASTTTTTTATTTTADSGSSDVSVILISLCWLCTILGGKN